MAYKEATEIENAEIKIFRLCKIAVENLYSKEHFKREVDKIIDEVCDKLHSEELKQKVMRSLRLYAQRTYAKQREILIESVILYAVLILGAHRGNSDAIRQKKIYDNAFSDKFRHSPGFLSVLEKELTNVTYPTAIPLGIYHKNYMRRVENLTNELIKARAKEDYTTNVSLRNIAEMTIRYEHQLNMIAEKRKSGKKLVYILAHANCSKRCQKYQIGGTKHPSGLYSLDGTSGVTEDGIRYVPLEFATDNPDDLYTTKAGITYQNGCLTGFNCRHKLGDYVPGVRPEPIPDSVIQNRREIEAKQREYERQIREYTKSSIAMQGINSKLSKKYRTAAIEKTEEYKQFSLSNNAAWYPERLKLFDIDNS